jgi:hypothetical protein
MVDGRSHGFGATLLDDEAGCLIVQWGKEMILAMEMYRGKVILHLRERTGNNIHIHPDQHFQF